MTGVSWLHCGCVGKLPLSTRDVGLEKSDSDMVGLALRESEGHNVEAWLEVKNVEP